MSKSQRDKGKVGEREVVNMLKACGHLTAERCPKSIGGLGGPDIIFTDFDGIVRYVSVKYGRHVPLSVCALAMAHGTRRQGIRGLDAYTVCGKGIAWVTRALEGCDELWCRRTDGLGWPWVIVRKS